MRTIGTPSTQARKLNAIASGALPNGDPVIVNANGTVSVVGIGSQSVGSVVTFETGSTDNYGGTYDPDTGKVIFTYRDNGNSFYGTAIVGTVSGSSISFGTAVVFESAQINWTSPVYDANAQKVVISYNDEGNNRYGTAIVGTVSGTSISFGTPVVFESARSDYISAAYNANAQKILVSYRDVGDSNNNKSIVGTVSGTSISFGSPTTFQTGNAYYHQSVYDSNAQKVVITYSDASFNGKAVVATISGTSVSFGTKAEFNSAQTQYNSIAYDSTNNTVVIAYIDGGDSDKGKAIIGTVSGTSISFNTATVFYSAAGVSGISATYASNAGSVVINFRGASAYGYFIAGTTTASSITFGSTLTYTTAAVSSAGGATIYDSIAGKVVVMFRDTDDSDKGKSAVYTPSATTLTSENYIGLSSNGYPDTAGATIDVQGAINDRQSGLTAGQSYYVQTDGTLTTTAGDPSVFAGTAISATKMIVKG